MEQILPRLALIFAFSAFAFGLRAQTEVPGSSPEPTEPKPKGITISGPAGVNISGPTIICKGGESILKAEGDYESFEWNTGAKDRIIRVREEGTYEVTATTKGGCKLTTSITVRVIPCT